MFKGFDQPRTPPQHPRRLPKAGSNGSSRSRGEEEVTNSQPRSRGMASRTGTSSGQKPPYLNVITNFSKPNPAAAQAPAMTVHKRNESLQERRRKGKTSGGSRGRIEDIKADDNQTGLSPSDRELMIGISIPGPPALPPKETLLPSKRQKPSPKPQGAQSQAEISPVQQNQLFRRGRPASSIYSRAVTSRKAVAPAPPLPPVSRYSVATSIETSSRCTSWATDFSEDDTLQLSRPDSRSSERPIVDRKSTDTIATKHRSQGWWNQLLSPFMERFDIPKEPSPPETSEVMKDSTEGNWKIAKSTETRPPRIDSIWAEMTSHSMSNNAKPFFGKSTDPTFNDYPGVHRGALVDSPGLLTTNSAGQGKSAKGVSFLGEPSPEIVNVQGMGLAAEYYEAYWHDQNSPTPYFKCENHVCSYGRSMVGALNAAFGESEAGTERSKDEVENSLGAAAGALAGATSKRGHSRQPSDTTVIDEDDANESNAVVNRPVPASVPAPLSSRPLPPPRDADEVVSPGAMSPGLREDYAARRAMQLQPSRPRAVEQEPPPRYPPAESRAERPLGAPEAPVGAASDRAAPIGVASDRAAPAPHEQARPREPAKAEAVNQGLQRPQPAFVHQRIGTTGGNGYEINDSHPTDDFPPPPTKDHAGEGGSTVSKKASFIKRMLGKGPGTKKERRKRRRIFCCIFVGLLLMVILIVVLVLELTLPRSDMSVQTSWVNVSGFPPIPTGIATIIRPGVQSVNGCIEPPTMWSCALPKEQQSSIAPNPPDQPNFRVEIRFQNGTGDNSTSSKRSLLGGSSAFQLLQRSILDARDSFTNSLFSPSPPPPGNEDQSFLGNTTDQNHQPFAGEATPFFMSFLDASHVSSSSRRLLRRQSISGNGTSSNSTDPFPNLGDDIPAPTINSDGTAASANLYPFPTAQPLMLYDRGLQSEHYGFYTYFDRSIFLKSASVDNITTIGVVPDDEDGGSLESAASLRCTWAQTRFLVQIWTNTHGNLPLISGNSNNGSSGASPPAASSSANNFTVPGSFPYPVSITMDRHGGDINSKSVYCYGMDDREHILTDEKKFQLEDRAFGGHLVNPALGLFSQINVSLASGGPGGIDGGTGGCSCLWRNFNPVG